MADFKYDPFSYADYTKSAEVIEAEKRKANAENAVANYGDFNFSKQADWNSIYGDYKNWNQNGFTYDVNADALYQQYKDKYIQQGRMAMADTIGQASAMTGGYGNSYAATVGNQAYQAHLDKLNDVIPELYQLAYDRHNQKGQSMLNMLGLLGSERDFEYGTWGDGYNKLVADRGYYSGEASDAYNRDYGTWNDNRTFEYGKWNDGRNFAYGQHRDGIADSQWQSEYTLRKNADDRAAAEWELRKKAYEVANGQGSYPSGNNKPVTDAAGATDLINAIVSTGAVAKGKTVDKSTASGQREITSAINKELNDAVKAGAISADEARRLKKELNPRGYTK
jgi:hypothetical protein